MKSNLPRLMWTSVCFAWLASVAGVAASYAAKEDSVVLSSAPEAPNDAHPVVTLWDKNSNVLTKRTIPEKVRITAAKDHVVSSVHNPSITVFLPDKSIATGAAVVVIPGGGHREIWMDHEGYNVARWLSERGIAAFVVKYRLAREEASTYHIEVESLQDILRAIRVVRSHSGDWGVDPKRIGVIGFSAGGELASLAAMRGDTGHPAAADLIERQSSLPDFQALIYPGNAKSILPGKNSAPAFLVCGQDDREDISDELPNVYHRFKKAGVSAELHIYAGVGHGFGIRPNSHTPIASWPDRFRDWLDGRGFLKP